jgi:hypothetical protein
MDGRMDGWMEEIEECALDKDEGGLDGGDLEPKLDDGGGLDGRGLDGRGLNGGGLDGGGLDGEG